MLVRPPRYFSCEDIPSDIPFNEFYAMRKVKLFSEVSTYHDRLHLTPQKQVRQGQGKDLLRYQEQTRPRHPGLQIEGLSRLPTIAKKRARGYVLEDRKLQKEASLMEKINQAVKPEEPPQQEVLVVEEERLSRLKRLAGEEEQPERAASIRSGSRRAATKRAKHEIENESDKNKDADMSEEEIRSQLKDDAALQAVALRMGTVPACLLGLCPSKALRGEKLGNQTFTAAWEQSVVNRVDRV